MNSDLLLLERVPGNKDYIVMLYGGEEKDSIIQHFQPHHRKDLNMMMPAKGLLVSFHDISLIPKTIKKSCMAVSRQVERVFSTYFR